MVYIAQCTRTGIEKRSGKSHAALEVQVPLGGDRCGIGRQIHRTVGDGLELFTVVHGNKYGLIGVVQQGRGNRSALFITEHRSGSVCVCVCQKRYDTRRYRMSAREDRHQSSTYHINAKAVTRCDVRHGSTAFQRPSFPNDFQGRWKIRGTTTTTRCCCNGWLGSSIQR